MPLYIDDGYTATKALDARKGLHPSVAVEYRPAIDKDRKAYAVATRAKAGDGAALEQLDTDLIAKHVTKIDGGPTPDKARLAKLHPQVRADLVDLILSALGADEEPGPN
jgi:hypothetical protein